MHLKLGSDARLAISGQERDAFIQGGTTTSSRPPSGKVQLPGSFPSATIATSKAMMEQQMFMFAASISDDDKTLKLELRTRRVRMSALELEDFIRELGRFRASMMPAVCNERLSPTTIMSAIPCLRWEAGVDRQAPSAIQLSLLHPGFGWVFLPLAGRQAGALSDALQRSLDLRPGVL